MELVILVTGHPVAKGRGRVVVLPNGRPSVVTPKKTRRWEQDARDQARLRMLELKLEPLTGPLVMTLWAMFDVSKSWPAWKQEAALAHRVRHTSPPDLDNLVKAAKDAMNGVVWMDDRQVVALHAQKFYSRTPGVKIVVNTAEGFSGKISRKSELEAHATP